MASLVLAIAVAAAVVLSLSKVHPASATAPTYPTTGWTIHLDATKHFPGNRAAVEHHFCRPASGGIIECQLYESDQPDARLVGVEVVVPASMYQKFDKEEKASWHYHRDEIPRVNLQTPDMTKEEADKVAASLMETYGKVYLLWDPT
ncbi:MAG: DUF1264 domain-containing protein [Vulcanimicrobiaceae bacterium]